MTDYLRPLFDYLVVKEHEPEEVRKSGLVLPADRADTHVPPHHGTVLAAGPGLDWWQQQDIEMPVKKGDHVVFPAQAGVYVEVEEEKLLVLRVQMVLGVMEPEPGSIGETLSRIMD